MGCSYFRFSLVRACRRLLLGWPKALIGAFLGLVPASVRGDADAWNAAPGATDQSTIVDLELMLRARRLLLQDEALAAHNLGVSVKLRTATLWGQVPSQQAVTRAEERVRKVLGIAGVRSELVIKPMESSVAGAPLRSLRERSPLAEPMVIPVPPPRSAIAQRYSEPHLAPGQETLWRPAMGEAPSPEARTPTTPSNPATTWRAKQVANAPTSNDPSPGTTNNSIIPTLRLPPESGARALPADPAGDKLRNAVELVRRQDTRYEGVRASVRGAVVFLGGTVLRWEDAFTFARLVAQVPGVERVVIEELRANPAQPGTVRGQEP